MSELERRLKAAGTGRKGSCVSSLPGAVARSDDISALFITSQSNIRVAIEIDDDAKVVGKDTACRTRHRTACPSAITAHRTYL